MESNWKDLLHGGIIKIIMNLFHLINEKVIVLINSKNIVSRIEEPNGK